jgi:hypothetical protein
MQPWIIAEKWPQLMAAKATVEAAVREANAVTSQPSAPPVMPGAGMPNFGAMPGMGAAGMDPGMMGADMQAAAARMMQDPVRCSRDKAFCLLVVIILTNFGHHRRNRTEHVASKYPLTTWYLGGFEWFSP